MGKQLSLVNTTYEGTGMTFDEGAWFHPRLAVPFARWCNPDFGVWCDIQIAQNSGRKAPALRLEESKA